EGREISVVGVEDLRRGFVFVDLGKKANIAHFDYKRIIDLRRIERRLGQHRVGRRAVLQIRERDEARISTMPALHNAIPSKLLSISGNERSRSETVPTASGHSTPIAGSS